MNPHRPYLLVLVVACSLISTSAWSDNDDKRKALQQQIQSHQAEIERLQQQLESLNASPQAPNETAQKATPFAAFEAGSGSPFVPDDNRGNSAAEEALLATALESDLIRQGAAVLSPGSMEVAPEISYFYTEVEEARYDGLGTALTLSYGLPGALQADLYLPYVVRDRIEGVGHASGVGDVSLGLTKELVSAQGEGLSLLAFGSWKTKTGDANRFPATGTGQHAVELGLTATKRQDPILLLASASYTTHLGSVRLDDDTRFDAGNVFGVRLGANLAATPATSFYWGIAYNTRLADRLNADRLALSSRARGYLELGTTTTIGFARYISLGVAIGVTSDAPDLSFTASMPIRF